MSVTPKIPPANAPLFKNAAMAPVIFFDGAPALGAMSGIIEIELTARSLVPKSDNSVGLEILAVAHLRCSHEAAAALRDSLDKTLNMAAENSALKLAS